MMGNAYTYPDGPDLCQGISNCPKVDSPTTGGLIFLYLFWAFTAVIVGIFFLYRHVKRNTPNSAPRSASRTRSSSAPMRATEMSSMRQSKLQNENTIGNPLMRLSDVEMELNAVSADDIIQMPYHTDPFGTLCYYLLCFISVGWIVIYFLIIFDFYYDCQLRSIDSLCYYGSYPLLGDYDTNAEYFFTVWCLSTFWFLFGLLYKDQLRGWFMIPCAMENATHMYVWSRDAASSNNDLDDSLEIVKWVRAVQKYITPERLQEGHEAFLEVQRTSEGTPFFIHDATRYLYSPSHSCYALPSDDVIGDTYSGFHQQKDGLSTGKVNSYLAYLGINKIPFERRSISKITADEMFTYFYMYQFVMYIVWFWQSYLFVAFIEASVVIAGAVASVYIQYTNEKTLSVLTEYETTMCVKRDGKYVDVSSYMIVPGDVVILRETDWVLPCDLVVLEGSCVLNEAGLTGESMPVQKTACVNENVKYNPEGMGVRHTLFAGTTVLELNTDHGGDVVALVTSTGVRTSKGQLVASILFPEKIVFKYEEELIVVVCFLLIYGIVLFILSIYLQENSGSSSSWITKWVYGKYILISSVFLPFVVIYIYITLILS